MTAPQPLVIRLGKLLLWNDTHRYDIYPRFLAALDVERPYTHRELQTATKTLAQRGIVYLTPEGIRNLPTCELLKDGSIKILGIGLVDTIGDDGLTLTQPARHITDLYRTEPEGQDWKVALAEHLLRYEIRLRTLIRYLCKPGATASFRGTRFLGDSLSQLSELMINLPERSWQPLKESTHQPEPRPFTLAVREDIIGNIGPFWREAFAERGVRVDGPWHLTGIQQEHPSHQDVTPRIRPQLSLLHDLGLFRLVDESWALNITRFRQLFSSQLQSDMLEQSEEETLLGLLQQAYKAGLRSDEYIHASELARRLADLVEELPDDEDAFLSKWVSRFEFQGHLRIVDHFRGLPGDGPGLNGDPNYQLIKIAFGGDY